MHALEELDVQCPHCWSAFSTEVDCSTTGRQEYVEDCPVCCAPIRFIVTVDPDQGLSVELVRDDE
ncbi:MAG TPA: CPXCG motif-containing cysteine-rich protein [Gammaproteobacteria bacterium]|nr:CPXCG motif-containing cysteine-rich protein [Gammaproteobacteria bacterium]